MGIYLNPGTVSLQQSMNSRFYVDKSMLIAELNRLVGTEDKFVCVSRARRFGKTMAGNMIAAYYSKNCDSREIFSKLKIAQDPSFEKYLNKINVIKMDVNGFYSEVPLGTDIIPILTARIRKEMVKAFPTAGIDDTDSLAACMLKVYSETGEKFVIIMDEYDVMVRETDVTEAQFKSYLRFLNSLFKNADLVPVISLAYLTGILPIIRDRVQSKLNVFREYSMVNARQFSEFVGFTKDEVQKLCEENNMNFDEVTWYYDGYLMANGTHIYSPKSVVEAMGNQICDDYWTVTGHFDSVRQYVKLNFDGLKESVQRMMAGEEVPVNVSTYVNSMKDFNNRNDVLTYLIHLGYLAYRRTAWGGEGVCWIPNVEIKHEWGRALQDTPRFENVIKIVHASRQLVEDTLAMNAEAVAKALDAAHRFVASNYNYNNEMALQSAIMLAYFYAIDRFLILKEPQMGNGRADVLLIPAPVEGRGLPAVIIEMKKDKTPDSALNQIKNKEYFKELENYSGDILFVGINYDSENKTHTCAFERLVK